MAAADEILETLRLGLPEKGEIQKEPSEPAASPLGRRSIRHNDPEWPGPLNELGPHDPPKELYLEGLPLRVDSRTVAVVGTRRPTAAGIEAAEVLTSGLVEAGFTIVSGMAMGIDTLAHRAALKAGGYTVAVLGSGLNVPYPRRKCSPDEEDSELRNLGQRVPAGRSASCLALSAAQPDRCGSRPRRGGDRGWNEKRSPDHGSHRNRRQSLRLGRPREYSQRDGGGPQRADPNRSRGSRH